jgi:hypothetical protein
MTGMQTIGAYEDCARQESMQGKAALKSTVRAWRFMLSLLLGGLLCAPATGAEPAYRALNPRAYLTGVKLTPLTPRPADLNDKVVYIIHAWPANVQSGFESVIDEVKTALAARFPRVKIVVKHKESAYSEDEPELWADAQKHANFFLYVPADSAATTMWSVIWSSGLEKRGIPGTVVHFETLENNARATSAKVGTPLRLVAVPDRPENLPRERRAALAQDIVNSMSAPLSEAEKKTGSLSFEPPPRFALEGTLAQIEDYFYEQKWTDGLPVVPPTEENVALMLKGTSHAASEIVTKSMLPEGWQVSVEKVAINAVMAGCRPEQLPVLLAAVEAFSKGGYSSTVRSTNSFSFMQVVNGPIAREIGMNSGTYALGPGNRANAAIGRALRLFIYNLGGGQNEVNLMGTQGNVGSYSFAFAENETASPWEPLHVSRGYKKNESTVTIFTGGWSHTGNMLHQDIVRLARDIAYFQWPSGMVALLSPAAAQELSKQGLGKKNVEERIWQNATLTMKEFRNDHYYQRFIIPILKGREMGGKRYRWPAYYLDLPDDARVPVYPKDDVRVVVVGGEANAMMQGWIMASPSTASVDKWR